MNELVTQPKGGFSSQLRAIHSGLVNARNDQERERIRDIAKAIENAAEILKMKSIQVEASFLVMDAERDITKANPPMSRQEAGEVGGRGKKVVTPKDDLISQSNLRNMRQAHTNLSDTEYSEIKSEAADNEEPLKRSKLQEIIKDKKRNQNRVEREIKLESSNTKFPDGTQKYGIIYADPPWRYDFSNTSNREIENHYPTMELQEIKDLGVPDICNEDCVLYLWATSAKAPEAFEVMEAWEFTYKSQFVWVKNKIGMGYWARNQHELLLIGTKGNFSPPEPENRISSVIHADRTEQHFMHR